MRPRLEALYAANEDAWWTRLNLYERSPEWEEKRQEVISRYGGVCQICYCKGRDVHHLTYQHVEHEYPFELVLLCRDCHRTHYGIRGDRNG